MNNKPKIVIIIPAYNAASTIAATLESIQQQSLILDFIHKIYIADDCSQDQTCDVAQTVWRCTAPSLELFTQPKNLAQWANLNRAITIARNRDHADWVIILHADDLAKPEWLATLYERILSCPPSVASICSSWDTFYPDGRVEPGDYRPDQPVTLIIGSPESVRDTLIRGCWWHISGCAIQMEAFEDIGEFHPVLPYMSDFEWLLRCLSRNYMIEYIPQTLILYRQYPASVSSNSFLTDRDIRERILVLHVYRHFLNTRYVLKIHLHMLYAIIRRIGRAVLRRSPHRMLLSGQTLMLIIGSAATQWHSHTSAQHKIIDV